MMKRLVLMFILCLSMNAYASDPSIIGANFNGMEQSRSNLSDYGFDFEFSYKAETWNVAKGIQSKSAVYVDNFDLLLDFDLQKMIGLKGAALHFYVLGNNGYEPNDYVESIHGITNIAAPQAWKLYCAAYEQLLFDDNFSVLVGMYDYNSEFDAKPSAGLFINPSQGIGLDIAQSGENGPSIFPTASLGIRLKTSPYKDSYFMATVLDGIPGDPDSDYDAGIILKSEDGLFTGAELGIDDTENENGNDLKIGAGIWYYTKEYESIASNLQNWGLYAFIDKKIYYEQDEDQGLSMFLRYGEAAHNKNHIHHFYAAGFVYTGLIPSRDKDILGFSYASGKFYASSEFCHDNNFELTYLMDIVDYFYIQPNIQYFYCTDENSENQHNFVAGIRFGLRIL